MSHPAAPSARSRTARQRRRGATLVLVAVTMSVLMAFAGIAIDFARMYSFAAQVKTLSDAAALSSIQDKKFGRTLSQAQASAIALVQQNRVNGADTARITAGDVEPGIWDFGARAFTASAWTNTSTNAVRVTARYPAVWTLARIFNVTNRTLTQSSVAALGSQVTSTCVKPFAIPYAQLLNRLGQPVNMAYNLTQADIIALGTPGAAINLADMRDGDPAGAPPGAFGLLAFNGNSTPDVAASISGCTYSGAGVGAQLSGATGNKWNANSMKNAIEALCGGNPNCPNSTPPILVPIYDQTSFQGSNALFRVKYIGAFKLVSYTTSGSNANLTGYLTAIIAQPGAGFSSAPGPVVTTALVQ